MMPFLIALAVILIAVPIIGPAIFYKPWFYVDAKGNWCWR